MFLESAGRRGRAGARRPSSRAAGLTQILAETGQNLLGMHVDVAASTRLTRKIAKARAARPDRRAATLRRARARVRRPLRPGEGARRHRALPDASPRSTSAARTWRSSPTTWASATSDAFSTPTAAARSPLRAAVLRLLAAPPRARLPPLAGFGDDSSNYLWKLLRPSRSCASTATTATSCAAGVAADRRRPPPRRCCTRPAARRRSPPAPI